MKKIKVVMLVIGFILVLVGCTSELKDNIGTMKGEVKVLNEDIIEIDMLDENKSKVIVQIKEATLNGDIKEGSIIEISYTGGIRESYPMQITATEINIISDQPVRKAIMIKGELYYNTEEEITFARCGVMDGKVDSTVGVDQLPTKDNQSNFGKDYEYQYTGERSVDVVMDNKWIRFAKDVDVVEGLNMEMLDYSNKHIKIEIKNNTEYDLNYGEAYLIEKLNEENWQRIRLNEEAAFIEIAYSLDSGKSTTWSTTFENIYGILEKGNYRIIKSFFNENYKYHIAVEFEIE